MELGPFDEAAEAVRAMVPAELGVPSCRARRWGLKVWFGNDEPARVHYEAQVVPARLVAGAEAMAIEIGWHAETRSVADNDVLLETLIASETAWRSALGDAVEAGPFLGRPDDWRRVSETWADADLSDPDLGLELGTRLVDYIVNLEPLLRS